MKKFRGELSFLHNEAPTSSCSRSDSLRSIALQGRSFVTRKTMPEKIKLPYLGNQFSFLFCIKKLKYQQLKLLSALYFLNFINIPINNDKSAVGWIKCAITPKNKTTAIYLRIAIRHDHYRFTTNDFLLSTDKIGL